MNKLKEYIKNKIKIRKFKRKNKTKVITYQELVELKIIK